MSYVSGKNFIVSSQERERSKNLTVRYRSRSIDEKSSYVNEKSPSLDSISCDENGTDDESESERRKNKRNSSSITTGGRTTNVSYLTAKQKTSYVNEKSPSLHTISSDDDTTDEESESETENGEEHSTSVRNNGISTDVIAEQSSRVNDQSPPSISICGDENEADGDPDPESKTEKGKGSSTSIANDEITTNRSHSIEKQSSCVKEKSPSLNSLSGNGNEPDNEPESRTEELEEIDTLVARNGGTTIDAVIIDMIQDDIERSVADMIPEITANLAVEQESVTIPPNSISNPKLHSLRTSYPSSVDLRGKSEHRSEISRKRKSEMTCDEQHIMKVSPLSLPQPQLPQSSASKSPKIRSEHRTTRSNRRCINQMSSEAIEMKLPFTISYGQPITASLITEMFCRELSIIRGVSKKNIIIELTNLNMKSIHADMNANDRPVEFHWILKRYVDLTKNNLEIIFEKYNVEVEKLKMLVHMNLLMWAIEDAIRAYPIIDHARQSESIDNYTKEVVEKFTQILLPIMHDRKREKLEIIGALKTAWRKTMREIYIRHFGSEDELHPIHRFFQYILRGCSNQNILAKQSDDMISIITNEIPKIDNILRTLTHFQIMRILKRKCYEC